MNLLGTPAPHAQHGRLRPGDRRLHAADPTETETEHACLAQTKARPTGLDGKGPAHRHRAGALQRSASPTRWPRPAWPNCWRWACSRSDIDHVHGARRARGAGRAAGAWPRRATTTRWSRSAASSAARPTTSSWSPTSAAAGVTRVSLDYQLPIANAILTIENEARPGPRRRQGPRRRARRGRDGQPAGRPVDERRPPDDPNGAPARSTASAEVGPQPRARIRAAGPVPAPGRPATTPTSIDAHMREPGRLPQGRLGALRRAAARLHRARRRELDALILPAARPQDWTEISPIEHARADDRRLRVPALRSTCRSAW